MNRKHTYPNIDMERTGRKLKYMIEAAGYTPKMIQSYLHLSCVQPIYRWYKGQILPSVDHLLMLSGLLGVHMEDLLVKKSAPILVYDVETYSTRGMQRRLVEYCKRISQLAA